MKGRFPLWMILFDLISVSFKGSGRGPLMVSSFTSLLAHSSLDHGSVASGQSSRRKLLGVLQYFSWFSLVWLVPLWYSWSRSVAPSLNCK